MLRRDQLNPTHREDRLLIKLVFRILGILALLVVGLFFWVFLSPRPALTIDPATLAGDGSTIDYCALPDLDGTGRQAVEIAKGNTPGCSYSHFPLPILADCTEPLIEGAEDIRGLWQAESGKLGHVERIEQCGGRTVVTAAGIIHDYGPNSTGGLHTNDTEGSVLFTAGGREFCARTSASMTWHDSKLEFNVLGWGPVVVRRYLDGEQLVWEYADGSTTRMNRICDLPEEHKVPQKRGRRFRVF